VQPSSESGTEYDVFVIYAEADAAFVKGFLLVVARYRFFSPFLLVIGQHRGPRAYYTGRADSRVTRAAP
jgi:hypothetical protein